MGIKLINVVTIAIPAIMLVIPGSGDTPLVAMSRRISINAIVIIRNKLDIGVKCPFLSHTKVYELKFPLEIFFSIVDTLSLGI